MRAVALPAQPRADQLCVAVYKSVYNGDCSLEQTHTSCIICVSSSVCGYTFPFSCTSNIVSHMGMNRCFCPQVFLIQYPNLISPIYLFFIFPAHFLFQKGNRRRRGLQRRGLRSCLMIHWQLTWIRYQ